MDIRKEIFPGDEDELQRLLTYGYYGAPEIKKAERLRYLGQLRERVIYTLDESRVKKGEVPRELVKALDDINAAKLIIKGDLPAKTIIKYEHLAKEHGVQPTAVYNPDFTGNTGLVVASEFALENADPEKH